MDTPVGKVLVKPPLAGRVEAFRKLLGGKDGVLPMTPAVLVALTCYEPDSGGACFGPADVGELENLAVTNFGPLLEAAERIGEGLALDPTTPATPPGST